MVVVTDKQKASVEQPPDYRTEVAGGFLAAVCACMGPPDRIPEISEETKQQLRWNDGGSQSCLRCGLART